MKPTEPPDQFDLFKSKLMRDAGMATVRAHAPDFSYQFHQLILHLPRGWIGQCEDIRQVWTFDHPPPQAWGACWNAAVRKGLLVEMATRVSMTAVKSHGRKTHLFRRT